MTKAAMEEQMRANKRNNGWIVLKNNTEKSAGNQIEKLKNSKLKIKN